MVTVQLEMLAENWLDAASTPCVETQSKVRNEERQTLYMTPELVLYRIENLGQFRCFLGPTVLAKTMDPKIMSPTKYVTPCTPFSLFPTCKSTSVGSVLRNVKLILVFYVGIYTGNLCCIVKLPDEVCVSHTKRVGEK